MIQIHLVVPLVQEHQEHLAMNENIKCNASSIGILEKEMTSYNVEQLTIINKFSTHLSTALHTVSKIRAQTATNLLIQELQLNLLVLLALLGQTVQQLQ